VLIREYEARYSRYGLDPVVLFAGELLESMGMMFLVDFGVGNAVNKATKLLTDEIDEDEWWARNGF